MTKTSLAAATLLLFAGSTSAAPGTRQIERAPVVNATPIYQVVEVPDSRQVCYDEEVRYQRNRTGPTLVGAIIGGVIGNRFGGGRGRDVATVAGTALGAAIGNNAGQRRGDSVTRVETRCEVVRDYREEERLVGYRVEYEYDGEIYTTRTDHDPGSYIDLEVSVRPLSR